MPSKLVDLCLLLIDKDIKLGDGGEVICFKAHSP
jgi:hypothetical protein